MTTLSAKADSFSDQSGIALEIRWPRPGQESASEDISRGVLVSVQGQPAVLAGVPSLAQFLWDFDATTGAVLGCPSRIHGHDFRSGSFGLAAKDVHEAGPAGIGDCTGERVVLEHVGHAQAFHPDQAVQPDEKQSSLVMMLVPQVADASMQDADSARCLSAVTTTSLFARGRALQSAKLGNLGLEVARVLDALTVARGEKRFEPYVDATSGKRARRHDNGSQVARQDHEPLVAFAHERSRLDRTLNGAVDLGTDRANVLDTQPVVVKADTIAVGREGYAVEVVAPLEAREARRSAALFAAAEEVLIGRVQSAQRRLLRREVSASLIRIVRTQILELVGLHVVVQADPTRLVGELALLKGGIVEPTMCLYHDAQFARLVGAGVEAELESSAHLLPFLSFDVPSHTRLGDGAARARIVAATPQRRQPRTQRRELSAQVVRRATLEAVHKLGHRTCGIRFKEQMHVVGHDFERVNRGFKLSSDLSQQLNQSLLDRTNEHGPAVLWAPHQVKLQGEDRSSVFGVSLDHLSIIHTPDTKSTAEGDGLPLPAKAGSPRPVN